MAWRGVSVSLHMLMPSVVFIFLFFFLFFSVCLLFCVECFDSVQVLFVIVFCLLLWTWFSVIVGLVTWILVFY